MLGGGPVGTELGQAFGRLGSRVAIVKTADGLLPREEAEAQQPVAERRDDGFSLVVDGAGGEARLGFDRIVVPPGAGP